MVEGSSNLAHGATVENQLPLKQQIKTPREKKKKKPRQRLFDKWQAHLKSALL
jgi:hypothetical protein